jgi:glycerol kinase
VPGVLPEITETTSLGAALLAGVGVGMWTIDDVARGWRERRRFEPRMAEAERAELLGRWSEAVHRARGWDE